MMARRAERIFIPLLFEQTDQASQPRVKTFQPRIHNSRIGVNYQETHIGNQIEIQKQKQIQIQLTGGVWVLEFQVCP